MGQDKLRRRIVALITPFERAALILLVLTSALLYYSHSITVVESNDSTGYVYGGIRIAETSLPSYENSLNEWAGPYFTLHAFKVRVDQTGPTFYLNYSPGFPLIVALFRLLIPHPEAVFYASPTMALLGLVGMYALGEALFCPRVGLAAAILLAFDPVYFQMAVLSRSDAPATAMMLCSLALFVVSVKRESRLLGLLSGLALGFACLTRYVMVLTLVPLGVYLVLTYGRASLARTFTGGFALGFGAFAVLIMIFNRAYYGGFMTTGYSPPHFIIPYPLFHPSYFFGQSPLGPGGYAATLRGLTSNFKFLLALAPLSLLAMSRPAGGLITSLALVFPLLFSFYLYGPEDFGSRFLLPSFAALYLMVSQLASRAAELIGHRRAVLSAVIYTAALIWSVSGLPHTLEAVNRRNEREASRVALIQEFTSQTEQTSVFLARRYHDQIILYGHRSAIHFDMIPSLEAKIAGRAEAELERGLVRLVNTLLEAGVPVYWIPDPDPNRPDQLQPDPILKAHFRLRVWRERNPVIYSIQQW
jgi:4-amino-4-deoxy-L-arabinose transferase-like glycosyltransferase